MLGFMWKPFPFLLQVFKNTRTSYDLMTKKERCLMFALFFISFSLLGYKFNQIYTNQTVLSPKNGGRYTEVMVGEVKYLNPILAQTDAEKSISKLLFSGLIKVSADGKVLPDLAESYEIGADGKSYTFHLRKNAKFSDGTTLTAQDVAYTIDSIKTPELKSSLNKGWIDVEVNTPDEFTISMTLPNAYGPFIYNCDFGILPAGISNDEFSKKMIGSGPFSFIKLSKNDAKINEVRLERNKNYYLDKPYIEEFNIKIFPGKPEAENIYNTNNKTDGIFGGIAAEGKIVDFRSSKRLGLVFNIKNEKLKDKAVRQKILEGSTFENPLQLGMTTLDGPLQREKAEELKKKLESQNIKVEVFYFNAVKLQDVLAARNYELLLYGFDFGNDRDPYTFWHSSQESGQNFAGWSNEDADILLEDARMLTDDQARNAKYDQFFALLSKESLVKFFDPVIYNFRVKDKIKGLETISGTQPFSRYENVNKWYIKEKRVRK